MGENVYKNFTVISRLLTHISLLNNTRDSTFFAKLTLKVRETFRGPTGSRSRRVPFAYAISVASTVSLPGTQMSQEASFLLRREASRRHFPRQRLNQFKYSRSKITARFRVSGPRRERKFRGPVVAVPVFVIRESQFKCDI